MTLRLSPQQHAQHHNQYQYQQIINEIAQRTSNKKESMVRRQAGDALFVFLC